MARPDDVERELVLYGKFPDTPDGVEGRLFYFASPGSVSGEAKNMEPHKASEIGWFPLDRLPEPFVPAQRFAISEFFLGKTYSEFLGSFSDSQKKAE